MSDLWFFYLRKDSVLLNDLLLFVFDDLDLNPKLCLARGVVYYLKLLSLNYQ